MATFTPNANLAKDTNPKDWAYHLGCLPLTDHIVFTKESFLSFLKVQGIAVSPNYSELNKLPRWATIGSFSSDPAASAAVAAAPPVKQAPTAIARAPVSPPQAAAASSGNAVRMPDGDVFRASRRVREPVGGGSAQVGGLFAPLDDEQEASDDIILGGNGRRGNRVPSASAAEFEAAAFEKPRAAPQQPKQQVHDASGAAFKPTRRVREAVGGGSEQVASLFGGGGGGGGADESFDPDTSLTLAGGKGRRGMAARAGDNKASAWAEGSDDAQAQTRRADAEQARSTSSSFRPTRRVREAGGTGGASSIVLA